MSNLLCNVLKISGGQMIQIPPLVARLDVGVYRFNLEKAR